MSDWAGADETSIVSGWVDGLLEFGEAQGSRQLGGAILGATVLAWWSPVGIALAIIDWVRHRRPGAA